MTNELAIIGKAPEFDWKPINTLPPNGKYLILNMNPRNKDVTIGTVTVTDEMNNDDPDLRKNLLAWALAWDYFPLFVVKSAPTPTDGRMVA